MLNDSKRDSIRSNLFASAEANGIRHGYFTRIGGVSEGIYKGLNVGDGSEEDQSVVTENRRRVAI